MPERQKDSVQGHVLQERRQEAGVSEMRVEGGGEMKYRIIEAISTKTLLAKNPCRDGYADYIREFGISELVPGDFAGFISWAKENGHINWLISYGFIKEVEPEIAHCPFCTTLSSRMVVSSQRKNLMWVECVGCRARGPERPTQKGATRAWNERCQ